MKYHLCLQFYALVEEIIVHLRHKVRDLCKALWDPRKEKKLGLWGHQRDPQTDSLLSLLRYPGSSVLPTLSGALPTPFLTLSPGRAPSVCQTKSPWHAVPAAGAATHTSCQAAFVPLPGRLRPSSHWWASEHTRSCPRINQSISVRRQCSNPRQHSLLKGSKGNWVTVTWASLILSSFLLGISWVSWASLWTALIWSFHCDSALF